jgi:tetratricopeptide (TPR) repeat protein
MSEAPLNHPTDETLRALSLGQLAEAELDLVSAHLGECPACCCRIDQLAAEDRLLARLQQDAASRDKDLVSPAQRRAAVRALRRAREDRAATPPPDLQAAPMPIPATWRVGSCSSLDGMRPVRLRDAKGENDPVVWPGSEAMPPKSAVGDRYQLFGEIARGGMGAVLRARDRDLGRNLAVKVLLEKYASLPEAAQRFVEEAQIGGQLQHPGVVPVYDIGRFGDRPFFTMKLVEGQTLAAILSQRLQSFDDRPRLLIVALKVAEALAYAHAKGVIHRDLKPSNIMVGAFGEVQVMDWGLAKVLPESDGADEEKASQERERPEDGSLIRTARSSGSTGTFGRETKVGSILGTPAYMPPEQATGDIARLDRRADVFGLGAILCEILTGQPPNVGESSDEVQRRAAHGDLAEAHARLDMCGADLALIILTKACLSPQALDRPRDAQAVADGLSAYLNGVQERLQATERERAVAVVQAKEESKRRKVQLALAAAVVGLLVGGGAFAFWRNAQVQAGRERDARNAEAVAALLGQCEEALRAEDAAKAALALEAARKRSAEGGAQEQAERLGRLEADLALVRDLDAVDQLRWTVVENRFPDPAVVATQTREAVRRFGADPSAVSVEEAAARISASVACARVVAALDRLLQHPNSAGVRTLLRRVDPDPYRDAFRDAVLANDRAQLVELVGQKATVEQPPGFVVFLGNYEEIPVERRRQVLQAAVSQRPGDLGLLMTLAYTYLFDQKGADERRCWFQAAVAAAPTNAAAHYNLGVTLKDKGQVDEAIACIQKAIDLAPKFTEAHTNLGTILCDDKREYDRAIACFLKAITFDPTVALIHNNLGNALYNKRQLDEAIACYQKAITLDPKFSRAHNGLGQVRLAKDQINEASACFRKALDLDPKLANAHNGLGITLAGKGQVDEAIACFQKAIELDPKLDVAYLNLGIALQDKGQLEEAIACYQKALSLNPMLTSAHNSLGVARHANGEVDEAIACFQKAIALDSNYARAHHGLGIVLAEKKQLDEAIACFRKAIALDSKLAIHHNSLGLALATKGQVDEAIACFRKALALNPNYARARGHLARWERLAAIRDKLAAFQNGTYTPATPSERLDLVEWCQVKKLHQTAAGLYTAAFAADPRLADDLPAAHRYNGACHAALAAAGKGDDAATLDDKERTRLRHQALAWLRADLALWAKQLGADQPADRVAVQQTLGSWQQDTDLAGLRDAAALAKLPAEEQQACAQLWADVAALLKKAEEKPT